MREVQTARAPRMGRRRTAVRKALLLSARHAWQPWHIVSMCPASAVQAAMQACCGPLSKVPASPSYWWQNSQSSALLAGEANAGGALCEAEATLCAGAELPPLNDSSPEESAAAPAQGGAFPADGGLMKAVDDVAPDRSAVQVRAARCTASCRVIGLQEQMVTTWRRTGLRCRCAPLGVQQAGCCWARGVTGAAGNCCLVGASEQLLIAMH